LIMLYVALPCVCSFDAAEPLCRYARYYRADVVGCALLLLYPQPCLRSRRWAWPLHGFGAASLLLCVLYSLYRHGLHEPERFLAVLGIITGRAAAVCSGLLLLAVSRRAVKVSLDGSGYADLVPPHRAAGWWCVAMIMIHSLAFFLYYWLEGGLERLLHACLPLARLGCRGSEHCLNRLGLVNFLGVIGTLAAVVLGPFSAQRVRRASYELFYAVHLVTSLAFLLFGALHDFSMMLFALPGACFYAYDRIVTARSSRERHPEVATAVLCQNGPSSIVLLTWSATTPSSETPGHRWVSICADSISKYQWHPFSVIECCGQRHVLIKGLGDWTQSVCQLVASNEPLSVRVEGPFGRPFCKRNERPRGLLLVAGGVGISPFVDLLSGLRSFESSQWHRVTLLWAVRHQEYAGVSAFLNLAAASRVADIKVFVTSRDTDMALASEEHGRRVAPLPCYPGPPLPAGQLRPRARYALACVPAIACVAAARLARNALVDSLFPVATTSLLSYLAALRAAPVLAATCLAVPGGLGLFVAHGKGPARGNSDELLERLTPTAAPAGPAPAGCEVKFARPDLREEMAREAGFGPLDVQVCGPPQLVSAVRRELRALAQGGSDISLDVHDPAL